MPTKVSDSATWRAQIAVSGWVSNRMASGRSGPSAGSANGSKSLDRSGGSSVATRPPPVGARWLNAHRSAAGDPPTGTDDAATAADDAPTATSDALAGTGGN